MKPSAARMSSAWSQAAAGQNNFVRVDMESSAYTSRTLDLVTTLHARHASVGAVIQAYLKRSEKDIEDLCRGSIRVRLCKGAYLEPASVAFEQQIGRRQELRPPHEDIARIRSLSGHRDTR